MIPEPDFLRPARGRKPRRGQLAEKVPEPVRCPNNHPAWHLYYKRLPGTTETILCCHECERT